MPDRHEGDLGLEAFSHDGHAYQCYAAEEPLTVKACYENQRDKLTTDLGKLKKNRVAIAALLGTVVIRRYVFMVHRHDSRYLIPHAHVKAAEVVSWGLPFIDPAFSIVVETDDDYANERELIHALPVQIIGPIDVEVAETEAWAELHDDLQGTARRKLAKVVQSIESRERTLAALTNQYLLGENSLERLKSVQPETYRGVLSAKARKEDLLVLEYPGISSTSGPLAQIAKDFTASLREDFPTLNDSIATTLAWSAVADWLMRCPLDFEVDG